MASKNEVFKASGYYNGHSARGNFDVELKLRFTEGDLADSLQFIAGLGKHIRLVARTAGVPDPIKLGTFSLYNLRVDKDANCYLSLRANQEYVFINNFTKLMEEEQFEFAAMVLSEEE